jgi:tetratricopeptide (TPR) repeat protein
MIFSHKTGLAALTLEAGGLATVLSYSNSQSMFAAYLVAHAAASGLLAAVLMPLLPQAHRSRPIASYLFYFAISFFIPVLGVLGLLAVVVVGRLIPQRAKRERFEVHEAPRYDPRVEEIAAVHSKGGVRVQLQNPEAPTANRLKALLAVQSLPARVANPLVRELLSDPSDDLRLVAYGILDAREKSINARIHAAMQRLAQQPPAREREALERQLADLYWELIYQGLVQGDLRDHARAQARAHLDQALSLNPTDAALWALCGRLATQEGGYEEARRAFERAREFGMPEARVLPYLAEAAFRQRRFDDVQQFTRQLSATPQTQRTAQIIRYWGAA